MRRSHDGTCGRPGLADPARWGRTAALVALLALLPRLPADPAVSPPPSATTNAPGPLVDSVVELLRVLQDEKLISPADPASRRAVVRAILREVGSGTQLVESESRGPGAGAPAADVPAVGPTEVLSGGFLYIPVRSVDGAAAAALQAALGDAAYGHFDGLVVELRYADGDPGEAAAACCEALARPKLPVVLLVNRETSGAAERLADALRTRIDAVTVGQATRGSPQARRTRPLASGDRLLLPASGPGAVAGVPIQPDVRVEQELPVADVRRQGATAASPRSLDTDLCLRRAVDLLTAIRALASKHF